MSKIRIITDSASDISTAEEQKYNILILPFPVTIGDKSYMSRVDFDNDGFYKLMEENPNELPKTAQITAFQFDELYKEQFDAGYTDIIFVSINKKGSATHDNAVMAKNEFFEEHPEYAGKGTIQIFDGVGYSGQYGYPVVQAAKMAEEGKTVDEITAYLSDILPKRRIYFGIYGLKYAAKSGRIPSAAALVGDALGVKPIIRYGQMRSLQHSNAAARRNYWQRWQMSQQQRCFRVRHIRSYMDAMMYAGMNWLPR